MKEQPNNLNTAETGKMIVEPPRALLKREKAVLEQRQYTPEQQERAKIVLLLSELAIEVSESEKHAE